MIATPLTELLGVDVPLISAPMTPQAGGRLARAVSEAGAFGMIGIEETDTEEGSRPSWRSSERARRCRSGSGSSPG